MLSSTAKHLGLLHVYLISLSLSLHNRKNKNMNGLISTSLCKSCTIFKHPSIYWQLRDHCGLNSRFPYSRFRVQASANELDKKVAVKKSTEEEIQELEQEVEEKIQNLSSGKSAAVSTATAPLDKDLKKVRKISSSFFKLSLQYPVCQ